MSQDPTERFDDSKYRASALSSSTHITSVDEFEVLELAGKGGQGQVYKARDTKLLRTVAIKLYKEKPASTNGISGRSNVDPERQTWLDEARRLASLESEGVAKVYSARDAGWAVTANGALEVSYIVMEWIDGSTFKHWIRSHRGQWVEIAIAFCAIAETLRSCHSKGIIHRDVKPDNIMALANQLSEGRTRFKIIDFGLAISTNSAETAVSGTIPWMSPEQVKNTYNVDGRSDLYSLGVILYEAITELHPYQLDGLDRLSKLEAICKQSPAPPSQLNTSVPAELEKICMVLLMKEPSDRYQNAEAVRTDLERFIQSNRTTTTTVLGRELLVFVSSNDPEWCDQEVAAATAGWNRRCHGLGAKTLDVVRSYPVYPRWSSEADEGIQSVLRWMGKQKEVGLGTALLARTQITLAYLLGYRMNNQYDVELFHSERGVIYPIGVLRRRVKDLRSPNANKSSGEELVPLPVELGTDSNSICIAFSIGANDMLQDIRSWQKSEGNLSSIVRYAKSSSALDPTTPEQWFRLAAEMAHQIKSRQEREIYLFMDCPGTIALMAAESLGTWSGKNIHLMQYLRVFERTHAEEAYTEFFHILS